MIVRSHETVDDVLESTERWLYEHEAINNVILGICSDLQRAPERFQQAPLLLSIEDDSGVCGAALMTPPHHLVLAHMPDSAVTVLAEYITAKEIEIPGIFGTLPLVRAFAKEMNLAIGRPFRRTMGFLLYLCQGSDCPRSVEGTMRTVSETDRALLLQWQREFDEEASTGLDAETSKSAMKQAIADQSVYVWETEKCEVVCIAVVGRQSKRGATITLVYTPLVERKRGYASALVANVTNHLLERGKQFVTLYTDEENPASNSVYRQIGYRQVAEFEIWKHTG